MMVDIGSESGAIEQDERNMIENIFEFNNMTAADVMVHRIDVISIHVDDTREEILKVIKESGLSRFPVYDSDIDDVIGILNTRDFLLNAQSSHPKTVRELLRSAYLVPETVPADTLFSNMQKQKIHLAVVVDEYGGTSGMVTMEDLLESIVGEIQDEYDEEEDTVTQVSESVYTIDGAADLEEVQRFLPLEVPEEADYDTLSGLLTDALGRIPAPGEHPEIVLSGIRFTVMEMDERRIGRVKAELLPEPEEQEAK